MLTLNRRQGKRYFYGTLHLKQVFSFLICTAFIQGHIRRNFTNVYYPLMKKQLLIILILVGFQLNGYGQNNSVPGNALYQSNFIIDGLERNFTFYMPYNYGKKDGYPLLLFLHDSGTNGKNIIKTYGDIIHAKADSFNCIVVYPDAVAGHWNHLMKSSFADTDTINDASFLSILIDYFIQQYNANANQIYVAGFSTGGEMAFRLACYRPSKITAIAPFINIAETSGDCADSLKVPAMNTDKFILQKGEQLPEAALIEAINFLLAHPKK